MINLVWHMGLGDAIACAAIAVKLSLKDEVTVPCWTKNEESVKSLFINHPDIKVLPMDNDCWLQEKSAIRAIPDHKTVLLGSYSYRDKQRQDEDFVQWFYRQAGMDISDKEKYCPIKEAITHTSQFARFDFDNLNISFCHEDRESDFKINKDLIKTERLFEVSAVPKEGSILMYANSLIKAPQVHCIDSSFLHLAEALNVKGKKFYHKYARPNSTDYKYLKGWEVKQ